MRRVLPALTAIAVVAVLPVVAPPAQATPTGPPLGDHAGSGVTRSDNRATPASSRQAALRQTAVQQLMSGDAKLRGKGRARTILMADGTEVSYPATQHAKLLTFLVDFGSGEGNPDFPTQTAGPVHDEIPEPGPSDNSTYWQSSFDRQHYLDMFFNGLDDQDDQSFKDIYNQMSSGRFDLSGDVSDWVAVDHPSSYYSQANGEESGQDMANFIGDSATAWFDDATATMTDEQVQDYLAGFDVWDRYDADNDGDFDEPDGYIDHFQAIHAGPGEEAGAAPWTIWSHRSGAAFDPAFSTGPDCVSTTADPCFLPGGVEIGDTGYWIFDYTTEPENGGLGVFAHEFGHDLGLPDYYDTDSLTTDNSVGFWNLMSAGSWLSNEGHATGTTPNHMGAYDKYYLGWYGPEDNDLEVVDGLADEATTVALGPSYHATTLGKQAVLVNLPDGEATVDGPVDESDDGAYLYSDNRSSSDALATSPPIEVPDVPEPMLSAKVAYDTEQDFDYAYLWVYDVEDEEWSPTPIETSESTDDNPEQANLGNGITGSSDGWVDLTADLSAYAGRTVQLQWEYLTDPATLGEFGFALDEIGVGDYDTGFDVPVVDWDLTGGFTAVRDNEYSITYPQAYFIENRQYSGYDSTLRSGPYSWGHNVSEEPYTVSDRFPYQDGLLIWYVSGRYGDNNTSQHPGGGATLPVDASAAAQVWRDENDDPVEIVDSRLQGFDATFDVDQTDALDLGMELDPGVTASLDVPARPSIPVFDDSDVDGYYDDSLPGSQYLSTKVAGTGAMIQVLSSDEETGEMVVKIGRRFVAATSEATISGGPHPGDTLTATPPAWFQEGVETSAPTWLLDGEPIEGAEGSTYEIKPSDIGGEIAVAYTGTLADHLGTESVSDPVEPTFPAPESSEPPTITGTTQVGQTLTAQAAEWPLEGDSTFAWSVEGQSVGTGATYVVRPADLGHEVTLTETFSSPGYEAATATATSATITTGSAPHATAGPSITGTAQVGATLTAVGATWPVDGESAFAWTVAGTLVGAGATYVVTPADLGKPVTLTQTFTSPGYDVATSAVDSVAVVPGAAPTATVRPKVTGSIRVGSTLKVAPATWPLAGSSTFAWSVGGKAAGTGTSYKVKPADAGKSVTVVETFTSPGHATGTASAASARIAKATVSLKVSVGRAKKGKKVSVTIRTSSPGLTVPGRVKVTYAGKNLGQVKVRSGKATVKLPAKKKGKYKLKVSYSGATGFGSASKTITVKVR